MVTPNGETPLISFTYLGLLPKQLAVEFGALGDVTTLLLGSSDGVRFSALLMGLITIAGGVLLMIHHKRTLDEVERTEKDERIRLYELRKFRRRTTVSSMIAAIGVILASLFWATEANVFGILVGMILILIVGVLGLAILDLLTVGIKSLAETDEPARQQMIDEYLRQRELLKQGDDGEPETNSEEVSQDSATGR